MKHTKETIVPIHTETTTIKVECDLCGKELMDGRFNVDDVTLKLESGSRYPESCDIERTTVDMCGECFKNKLLPWLESLGVKPKVEEIDW